VKLGDAKVMLGDHCVGTVTSKPGKSAIDFELTFTMDAGALKAAAATFRKYRSGEVRAVLVWSTADEPSSWVRANPGLDFVLDRTNGVPNERQTFTSRIVKRARTLNAFDEGAMVYEAHSDFADLQRAHEQRIDELARDLAL
jgi:hypothetical protein